MRANSYPSPKAYQPTPELTEAKMAALDLCMIDRAGSAQWHMQRARQWEILGEAYFGQWHRAKAYILRQPVTEEA